MSTPVPAVSVIVPCYNAGDTLPDTIASLRTQAFSDWEAVCVDDGSTDGTAEYLDGVAGRDERVRVVRGAHAGLGATRNRGIAEARSRRLLPLDADDVLSPDALERLVGCARRLGDGAIVFPGVELLDRHARPLGEYRFPSERDFNVDRLLAGNAFAPTALIPRSLLPEAPYDAALRSCEDWDLWLRLSAAGTRVVALPLPLLGYRLRPGAMTRRADVMAAAGERVLAEHVAPNDERHPPARAAWRLHCAALAAAAGDPALAARLLDRDTVAHVTPSGIVAAAAWAWQVVGGADGQTWASSHADWRTEVSAWLSATPLAKHGEAVAEALRRQHLGRSSGPGALRDALRIRRPQRLVVYGLGNDGVNLLARLHADPEFREIPTVGADDFASPRRFDALGLPRVNIRQWPRWPRDTFAVVTPREPEALTARLERLGARRGVDFVALADLPAVAAHV